LKLEKQFPKLKEDIEVNVSIPDVSLPKRYVKVNLNIKKNHPVLVQMTRKRRKEELI
jgi:hypothetical protein